MLVSKSLQQYYPVLDINEYEKLKLYFEKADGKRRVFSAFLQGPPGCGKTILALNIARDLGLHYVVLNGVGSMIDLDLIGSYVLKKGETIWQDGPLPAAIRLANQNKKAMLVINELNAMPESTQVALNPVLDNQACVVLTQKDNEVVELNQDARLYVVATMNLDVKAVNSIQDAVLDRSGPVIRFDYPSLSTETNLISKIVEKDTKSVEPYVRVAQESRKACIKEHTVSNPVSTRGIIDWIGMSQIVTPLLAFELTIANKYSNNQNEYNLLMTIAKGADMQHW